MTRIRILPERVANQIAAGEVVERPAAVVKELVENALDAGGTRIEVEFKKGGRALIRVEDNGRGMEREDAALAFERHATSKIAEVGDLDRLATFGFRGEALPSIASVSRCTLRTRAAGFESGTEILIDAGRSMHVRDCGCPPGTRIEVADLFHSVPARRKFLKSDATEAAHINQCVRLYALARPEVAFALIEDGRTSFRSPRCATLAERVAEIFGRQIAEALIPIESAEGGFRLTGLIGRPGTGRATRHELVTFVNGRPVDSRTLNYALIESYRDSLPKGRYPLAFVFLECDPAAVDVNVHPAKREVRFRGEAEVRAFIVRSVVARLRELAPTPLEGRLVAPSVSEWTVREAEPAPPILPAQAPADRASAPALGWRLLGLAHGSYAVFETSAGLVLLDRRAALERIWFERLRGQTDQGAVPLQRLLLPIPLELDPIASALLVDHAAALGRQGFGLAEFGRHFFRIEAVPAWMEPSEAEPFLRDVLGALREGRLDPKDAERGGEGLTRLAAAKAVRLGANPSASELEALARDLFATRAPHTSPSGRATFFELSHGELARRFQK